MKNYDIAIVGAGPAGMTAALYAARAGKSVLLLEEGFYGGQIIQSNKVENYPGAPEIGGVELAERMMAQLAAVGIPSTYGQVKGIVREGRDFLVQTDAGDYLAGAVILATGVGHRKLEVPGEEALIGRGVSFCATCDGMLYRNRPVAVLGYSESARREAEFLEGIGCQVKYFDRPRVCEITGEGQVSAVTCDGETENVDGVFILRPSMAPTELFPGLAVENGYVVVDRKMQTNLPGVFAAGDCTGGPLQVSKAVGEGLIAGQSAAAYAAELLRKQ